MKSRVLFLLALTVSSMSVYSQNLVPNGSFEEGSECPMFLDDLHFRCDHWYKSIQVPGVPMNENPSPDWYHACSGLDELSPPSLISGFQETFDGQGFAGLFNFDILNLNNREVMGVQLIEPLVIGEEYFLTFQLSTEFAALNNGIATDKFGFKLTTEPIFTSLDQALTNLTNGFITEVFADTSGWTEYSFQFVADSAYEFIHFGAFFTDDQMEITTFGNPSIARHAYVFMDDVNLSSEPLASTHETKENLLQVYPNPCTDLIKIRCSNQFYSVQLFSYAGILVKSVSLENTVSSVYIGDLPKGLYIVQIVLENGEYLFQTIAKT